MVCIILAAAQEEGEARPSSRGLLKRGPLAKTKGTTTTTTPAPQVFIISFYSLLLHYENRLSFNKIYLPSIKGHTSS